MKQHYKVSTTQNALPESQKLPLYTSLLSKGIRQPCFDNYLIVCLMH